MVSRELGVKYGVPRIHGVPRILIQKASGAAVTSESLRRSHVFGREELTSDMRGLFSAFRPVLIGQFLLWLLLAYACWWWSIGLILERTRGEDTVVLLIAARDVGIVLPIVVAAVFGVYGYRRYGVSPGPAGLAALSGMGLLALVNEVIGLVKLWGGEAFTGSDAEELRKLAVTLVVMALVAASSAGGAWWASRHWRRRGRANE